MFYCSVALFYACRRYLLHSLYHDLQDLSSQGRTISPAELDADALELETLPTHSPVSPLPSTPSKLHPKPANLTNNARNRTFHSVVSRTLFSLSFSESCTMFLLLMCQGLEIFHSRCVYISSRSVACTTQRRTLYSTRLLNWEFSLRLLLVFIMVLIPLSYSLVLSYRSSPGKDMTRLTASLSNSDHPQYPRRFSARR